VAGSRGKSAAVFVLSMVALGALAYLAWASDSHPLVIGLLVAIPLFAAIFLTPGLTTLVGLVVLATAGAVAWLTSDAALEDYYVPLAAVLVSVVVAIVSSMVRRANGAATRAHSDVESSGDDDLDASEREAQVPADSDPMTGLLNRRGVIRALGTQNAQADKVLAFLDCDHFREVNESYGTDVGDEFLQAIAGRLRHSVPARDTVARWDGDEFLVVISGDASSGTAALERVVGSISGEPIRTGGGPVDASISVGAAVWLRGQDLEDGISRAGRALHAAKSSGRGRVVLDAGPADASVADGDPTGAPD
jgi:diguanylate cyclase (GGDEF)-like protein